MLRAIGSATAYFSILPGGPVAAGAAPDAGALVALPLVGAAIGALAGCAALGVAQFAPHPIAAATALVLLVTLSSLAIAIFTAGPMLLDLAYFRHVVQV